MVKRDLDLEYNDDKGGKTQDGQQITKDRICAGLGSGLSLNRCRAVRPGVLSKSQGQAANGQADEGNHEEGKPPTFHSKWMSGSCGRAHTGCSTQVHVPQRITLEHTSIAKASNSRKVT